jgi:ribonuclease D
VQLITTNKGLAEWTDKLVEFDTIAVDTEGDSLHCYFEKLCLIQISVPKQNILIDPLEPLDFTRFNEVLSRSRIILHGCDYDLRMLRRGIKFVPGPIFDTYLAARLIGLKEVGLASLVKEFFQIELPKSSQKANWARRPLTRTMLEYAVNDTLYLIELAERLNEELRNKGRLDWFHESCRKAIAAAAGDREKDPERQWRVSGSAALRGVGLTVLRAIWYWRDAEAQKADRPSFQILRNEELVDLARMASEGKFLFPPNLAPTRKKRLEIVVDEAMRLPESEWPARIKTIRDRPTDEQERRLEQLKNRRDHVAQELDLDPGVLAPKQALERISREPDSLETMLMRWQRQALGL